MFPILSLSLLLATGVSAPAKTPLPNAADAAPQRIVQTSRVQNDGTTTVDDHSVDPAATTVRTLEPDGSVVEATWHPERRVLIELREPPALDSVAPGSAGEALREREQLAVDLSAIDARLQPRTASRITRQYHTLFSGVAATVDSAVIDEILRLPNVAAVHDDFEVHADLAESAPAIGAVAGTHSVSGAVTVAVIDTGIDYTHPDLGGCLGEACQVVSGYDFVNHDADPRDDHGHGTHVAGIIAANGTLQGVAPGTKLLAYKVLDSYGYGYTSDIIAALESAVLDGAKVANLSLGGQGGPDDPTSQALDNATAAGMLSVVAAGNSGYGYRTIESPGTARTALTVGATDGSWQMAGFSSRGYVVDGDQFVMKPEVVAPGVDIRSTVPTTGLLGNATGYAVLSGTSMAAPYVAGSAALLLQWDATQTPEEVKSRLVGSARAIDADLFKRGAGGIDLLAAYAVRILPARTHVSFGAVDASSGVVVREEILSVRNDGAAADTLTLAAVSALPAGTTLEIVPASVTLQASASADVTLRLRVDASVVPEPPDPLAWSTSIAITGATQTVRVPVYFFRGSVLTMTFDENPWYVDLRPESGTSLKFSRPGTSFSALVKSGSWDVLATFVGPVAIVAREQQNVQHALSLSFARSQATREATVRAIDETEQPLPEERFSRGLLFDTANVFTSIMGPDNFRLSELSSRFLVALVGFGPDGSGTQYFTSSWSGKGFSSDVVLPTSGTPFRRLAQSAAQPPGMPPALLTMAAGFAQKTTFGAIASLFGSGRIGVLSRTWHMQTNNSPGSPYVPILQSSLTVSTPTSYTTPIQTAYLHPEGPVNLEVKQSLFDVLDPSRQPEAVLGANVERWDLDASPNALPVEFTNTGSTLYAHGGFGSPYWLTHTISRIATVGTEAPTFSLYRNGTLAGTYPLASLGSGVAAAAGLLELRSTSAYTVGAVPGSTQAVIAFDTSKADPNPPFVSRFRIEQNGLRTSTPFYPARQATPAVRFRVTDNVAVTTVSLDRRTSGMTSWTPVSLTKTATDYEAALPDEGSVDLRLTATDSAGNVFREEWTPAVVTAAPPPPGAPSFITATRAAASAISLSWAAGSSPFGIAGYRIERLPGNTTVSMAGTGTTYVDTTGLVPGNAYLYRVSAIDVNDAVSTPTAYDLATLIELHDDPAVAGVTPVRGIHIADLRRAIDAIRQAAGLGSAWTDYDPLTGIVRASDFVDLRDRLNEARGTLQLPAVQFTDEVTAGAPVRANDLLKLRDGVK